LPSSPSSRSAGIAQEDLGVDDGALADLLHRLAEADARIVAVDEEGGHAPGAGARGNRGVDDVELGDAAVADPGLLAVQDVARVAANGGGGHGRGVGADSRLGGAECGQRRRLRRQRGQPPLLLLGRTHLDHRPAEEPTRRDQVADPGAAPVQLLLHEAAGQHILDAAAAHILGEHEGGEADRGRLVHKLDRAVRVALVHLGRGRADLAARELPRQLLDLALIVGQIEGLWGEVEHGAMTVAEPQIALRREPR
jgi:hypothetical protein